MRSNNRVFLGIAGFALAVLSCQALSGLGGGTPVAPGTGTPQERRVILEDDFSSASWGTGTDKDSSVEYADETLRMIIYTKNYFVWSIPNDENYENIHLEVTLTNNDTDPTTAFGIICNQQETPDAFYYFAVTAAGEYAIARAAADQKDVILTNANQFAFSDLIAANAPSYRLGADCGNGSLTLYVDGQQIDTVSDLTYKDGAVALFTWSGQDVASADVSFDDFVISKLP